jgi:ubiquinone/menaquinone biosynthesis C-methylase UbiE
VKAYYHARAPEYDDWWLGRGPFASRERPGWEDERAALIDRIERLPSRRTLDVACGTGFLTRFLPGEVIGLDQSEAMLTIAREQAPNAEYVLSDALPLPVDDNSFQRVFTSHFYGHLEEPERELFLAEARRVAPELIVVDASQAHSPVADEYQPRLLNDGSQWEVYKRWFTGAGLAAELGGGKVLHEGRWFVVVRSP